jgi:copper chaperone NosL
MRGSDFGSERLQALRVCLLGLLCVGGVLIGCRGNTDVDTPPDIRYGEDVCDQCRMIISERRFAAAYVTRQGETRRFDDIGDLVRYHRHHAEDVAVFWVHDYDSRVWLKAEQAYFVLSPTIHTPMGHGIVALGDKQRAAAMAAANQGEVLTFAELRRHPVTTGAASAHPHRHSEPTMPDDQATHRRTTP